jgi:uncharacterized protein
MVLIVHGVVQPFKSKLSITQSVAKHLKVPVALIERCDIVRRSVDARKRIGKSKEIRLVFNVHVTLNSAKEMQLANAGVAKVLETVVPYKPSQVLNNTSVVRPIVIGSGPAGLFAAYTLLQCGMKPVIIEQGPKVERRSKDLMDFWKHNVLSQHSNGVFGEGGAGAFSDGKLTTRTTSPYHRYVHETLIKYGAKPNILYESRAHIGTDQLRKIISTFSREGICAQGAVFLYNTEFRQLLVKEGEVQGVVMARVEERLSGAERRQWEEDVAQLEGAGLVNSDAGGDPDLHVLRASHVFLATGHSARSVFSHLHAAGVTLSPKDFAIGLRLQLSQQAVNSLQYGATEASSTARSLGAAEFSFKYHDKASGRSVYTFCMCPGGVVVNASHGGGEVAVNGMSYSTRASRFANAAFVVTVGSQDFKDHAESIDPNYNSSSDGALAGMEFQKYWEQKCFSAGGGGYGVPAQRVVDFIRSHPQGRDFTLPCQRNSTNSKDKGHASSNSTATSPSSSSPLPDHIFMGSLREADLHSCLPPYVGAAVNALSHFATSMPGLVDEDSLLIGIESRTSSPVRIERHASSLESVSTRGLYPLGEGAGHAGGIMTACVDGVRAVEAMVKRLNGVDTNDGDGKEYHNVNIYQPW